jgi:hypothetical protein
VTGQGTPTAIALGIFLTEPRGRRLSSAARTKTNKSFLVLFSKKHKARLLFEKRSKNFYSLVSARTKRSTARPGNSTAIALGYRSEPN